MSDTERLHAELLEHDRASAAFWRRFRRSLWAFGSGVGTMLMAAKLRDHGLPSIDAVFVLWGVGTLAMFARSMEIAHE